jgi:hypothetical protein
MEPTPPSSHEKQHYPGQEKAVDAISPRCASLAAQVKYITFYLNLSDRYMFTNDDFRVDWGEVWRTTRKVTPEEWDALRAELKATYQHLQQRMSTIEVWDNNRPLGPDRTLSLPFG